jgi:hypothetical protein
LAALPSRSSGSRFSASASRAYAAFGHGPSNFGDRLLEGFEAELKLFFRQTFGPDTELHPRQFQQQMTQSVILCQ